MICRHPAGHHDRDYDYPTGGSYTDPTTPDSKNYEIQEIERVGSHLVLKVLYPNCKKCAYEGNKVMVFLNVTEIDVLKWREIDPHFRAPETKIDPMNRLPIKDPKKAPSPAARFPASAEGWRDAIAYAHSKTQSTIGIR